MAPHRRWLAALTILFGVGAAARSAASPVSDFQARLAQTAWCLAQAEAILRSQPESSVPAPTPEALGSYLALVSENVTALTVFGSARLTNEQSRVIAEGLRATARMLRDEISLASTRGLTSAAAVFSALESSCRASLASP